MLTEEERIQNNLEMNHLGWCTNLKEDNTCSIYEERPPVCVVDNKKWGLSKQEYFKKIAVICNAWMDEDKSSYKRIKI